MASPVAVIVSSSTVEDHDVVTVTTPAHAARLMMSTSLPAPDVTVSLFDDEGEKVFGGKNRKEKSNTSFTLSIPLQLFTRFAWHVDVPPHMKLKLRPAVMVL